MCLNRGKKEKLFSAHFLSLSLLTSSLCLSPLNRNPLTKFVVKKASFLARRLPSFSNKKCPFYFARTVCCRKLVFGVDSPNWDTHRFASLCVDVTHLLTQDSFSFLFFTFWDTLALSLLLRMRFNTYLLCTYS